MRAVVEEGFVRRPKTTFKVDVFFPADDGTALPARVGAIAGQGLAARPDFAGEVTL